jgi:Na+-transporting methylmalonyl-CoA/oxaloacetate decarboxylase gamma subunit
MELFLPGIATLLILGLIVFLILPRLGAPVLAALSVVLLAYAIYNHVQLFSPEYRFSTWQDRLKDYAPFVIIGALILGILFYIMYLIGNFGTSVLPESNVPVANATEVVNTAKNAVTNIVENITGAANKAAEAIGFGQNNGANQRNNRAANRGSFLENVSKILNTPPLANLRPNNRRVE